MAAEWPWFETSFVDSVHEQFRVSGRITAAQREAIMQIRAILTEKIGR